MIEKKTGYLGIAYCEQCDQIHLISWDEHQQPITQSLLTRETAEQMIEELSRFVREGPSVDRKISWNVGVKIQ